MSIRHIQRWLDYWFLHDYILSGNYLELWSRPTFGYWAAVRHLRV